MENWSHKLEKLPRKLTRREALIGSVSVFLGLGLGIGAALPESPLNPIFGGSENSSPLKPGNGEAQSALDIAWLPPTVQRWKPLIDKYSNQYGVDPDLTAIIMTVESAGDPNAHSKYANSIMQFTPDRANDIATKFMNPPRKTYNLKDPSTAIEFGVVNIRHLVDTFGNPNQGPAWDKTVGLVAAGYNGGEGAARLYRDHGLEGLKTDGETHAYVRYVTRMWDERHDNKSFAYRAWLNPLEGKGQALVDKAAKYIKR